MAIALTGILGAQIQGAKELISKSAVFQAWVGAANEAAALLRIHHFAEDDDNLTYPLATVDHGGDALSLMAVAGGAADVYKTASEVEVLFVAERPTDYSDQDFMAYMTNQVGAIVEELRDLSGVSSNIRVKKFVAFGLGIATAEEANAGGDRAGMYLSVEAGNG